MAKRPSPLEKKRNASLGEVLWTSGTILALVKGHADAWMAHLKTPGLGTVERYVNARAALVRVFYPDYDGRVPERKVRRGKKA
jgi:hypothetical protein